MELPIQLIVRRWWAVVLVAAAVSATAGFLVSQRQDPVYQATVQLLVGRTSDDLNQLRAAEKIGETYAEIATRGPTLRAAAEAAGIAIDPGTFAQTTSANANELTRILTISVRFGTPEGAASLANALASELIKTYERDSTKTSAGFLRVIQAAAPSPIPVGPRRGLITLAAALAGAAAAFAIGLAYELVTDRVRDSGDVEALTGTPCIVIGSAKRSFLRRSPRDHGSYRLAAAALDGRDTMPAARSASVAVASKDADCGELALRIAEVMSAAGHHVVVVDADPAAALTAALAITGPGLAELLGATIALSDDGVRPLLRPTTLPRVSIMPTGTTTVPPIEADQATKVLQRLLEEGDRVVIATGSALDGTTIGWARSTDAVLLVATELTRRARLADAARALRNAGAQLTATVLRHR